MDRSDHLAFVASKASAPHPHEAVAPRASRPVPTVEPLKLTEAQKRELEERPDPFLDPWVEDEDAPDPSS